ncbi:MAG: hypothetical protein Q8K38_05215 [Burkholderiaceae bacterium]|nr:hypothetical protein [Burkholderiaceae bacterium]MDZ4144252.1 hypothetical protein [Burkholderiales bacterium]
MKPVLLNTLTWAGAAAVALALALAFPSDTSIMGRLPEFTAKRLDQRPLQLPHGLPAERTLVLVTFNRTQRPMIEGWIAGLQLPGHPGIHWLRMPVIEDRAGDPAARNTAENRLLMRYPSALERAHMVPLFTDREAFARAAGLTGIGQPAVLVLNRRGEVLARAEGAFDPDKAAALRQTLQERDRAH